MEYQNLIHDQPSLNCLEDTKKQNEGILESEHEKVLFFLKNRRFEEAINLLENSLLQAIKQHGPDTPELAKYYFNLGSAMLLQLENSREVFALSAKSAHQHARLSHQDSLEIQNLCNKKFELTTEPEHSPPGSNNQEQLGDKDLRKQLMDTTVNSQSHNELPNRDHEKENARNENEDPEDIQLVWEHLELARVYIEMKLNLLKDEGKIDEMSETMKFLSVIHTKLGNLNCYQENYKEALNDYETCLNLRKFNEDGFYSRSIAEAYYLIGQVHLGMNTKEADEAALLNFNKARIIVENNLSRIFGLGVKKDPENTLEHKSIFRKEFLHPNIFEMSDTAELKSVLLELYNKIEDTIQQIDDRDQVDNMKVGDFLCEQNLQRLGGAFEKLTSLGERKQVEDVQAAALHPAFGNISDYSSNPHSTKPGKNTIQIQSGELSPMKLGVFGNGARKRVRQELPIIPEKSEDSLDLQKQTFGGLNQVENITKLDEFGKPEKMIRTN